MVLSAEPPPKLKIPESKITELTDDANHDSPKLERRIRMHHFERHRSCVVTLSDMELNDLQPHRLLQTLEVSKSPGEGSQCSLHEETPTDTNASNRRAIADAAWEALKRSIVYFRDQPTGIVAAIGNSQGVALNYDQVFMRDFIPSALAFLMKGECLIVKNFLVQTARLQSREKMVDLFKLGQSVMPASFKVHHRNPILKTESLLADFGETAIGRVASVDSGLWWIILLRAYTRWTGDNSLAESPNCQRAMHLILSLCLSEGCDTSPAFLCTDGCSGDNSLAESPNCRRAMLLILRLCLSEGCDTSPALLCADGCSMIDQRMGICGYPIEKHALFVMTIMPALRLLKQDSDDDFVNCIIKRTEALRCYLHSYFSSPMGKRAICYGLTWLIMRLCFGGACDTSLASLADDDHSLIYMLNMCFSSGVDAFPALPHPDGHFCTGQEMLHIEPMESMKGCYHINTTTICLDGSDDQILASVRRGIARIRWWCKIEGVCVDISRLFGSNLEVFTTPADGTFHLTLEYESRSLTLCLNGRDLYLMGWWTEYGTFEIRTDGENKYMVGEDIDIIRLPFAKGYGTIAPHREVGLTRMGPIPLQQAFEILYKCRGEPSDAVKDSVGIFAVHFSEAACI